MTTDEPNEKYLVDGRAVTVIANLPDGRYLVDPIFECDEEEYYQADNPFIVNHIFDKPPVEKLNHEVAKLNGEIETLRNTRAALLREVEAAKRESETTLKTFTRYDELKELNNFIAGRVTHYVITGWNPRIIAFGETVSEYGDGKMKLLSLFGGSKGDLRWKLNEYYDGSGAWKEVIPCVSFENALVEAQKLIDQKECEDYKSDSIVRFAKDYNLHISESYVNQSKEQDRKRIQDQISSLQKSIDRCNKDLEKLEAV